MQKKEITMATAARIRYYRHAKGFSQEDLSLRAGLNPAYFGQVERGLKCPTVDTLYKIASALNISLSELVRFDVDSISSEESISRFKEILAKIPAEKTEAFFTVLEGIVEIV